MARRCPENKFVGLGILRGWRWIIDVRRYANVIRSSEDVVYGLAYEISPSDEARLDEAEGVPWDYNKEMMKIELQVAVSGKKSLVQALVYADEKRVEEGAPWEEYIHRINMGINDAVARGMPEWYIDKYIRKYVPAEEKGEADEGSKP